MSVSWDVLALPLLEVVLMGALAGVVGALALVHRRIFFTESLTHATFPGAVAGVVVAAALSRSLAGQRADYDLLTGALFIGAVLMCLPMIALMRWLSTIPGLTSQSAAGIVLTFGFALGYFLVKWFAPLPLKVDGFLTGSVLNIGLADVVMTTAVLLGALTVLAVAGRLLAFHGFDPVGYRAAGLRSGPVEAVLLILICLTIAALVPAVGTILPIALVAAPAAAIAPVVLLDARPGGRVGAAGRRHLRGGDVAGSVPGPVGGRRHRGDGGSRLPPGRSGARPGIACEQLTLSGAEHPAHVGLEGLQTVGGGPAGQFDRILDADRYDDLRSDMASLGSVSEGCNDDAVVGRRLDDQAVCRRELPAVAVRGPVQQVEDVDHGGAGQ